MLTNDELLYDPDMDDEDEKWVIKQRCDHRQKGITSKPFFANLLYFALVLVTFSCLDYFIIAPCKSFSYAIYEGV